MSFGAAVAAWVEKAEKNTNTSICKAFESVGVDLVELTKDINYGGFSNGDITNNWHVSVGGLTMVIPNGPDLTGASSLNRIRSLARDMPFYKKDNVVYITNVMNYAYRADKLGWPKGPGTNGWNWTGNVKAYGFVDKSLLNLKGKYM